MKQFEDEFLHFIATNQLLKPTEKVLVACSGGADSVALSRLLHQFHKNIALVHCNFQLRGADADADEAFVKSLAIELNVAFYNTLLNAKNKSSKEGISIQMAARELRYAYFEKLRIEIGFDKIAVGTNQSDSTETMILNQLKGTGIRGIHGIKPLNGHIIRPLLFAEKDRITQLCQKNNWPFRNDLSNLKTDYERNFIRLRLIPEMRKVSPNIHETFAGNAKKFNDIESLANAYLAQLKSQIINNNKIGKTFDFSSVSSHSALQTIVFEYLNDYGFNDKQCELISKGKVNTRNKVLKARDFELIALGDFAFQLHQPKTQIADSAHYLKINDSVKLENGVLRISEVDLPTNLTESTNNVFYFDKEKLEFPLTVRKWKAGDSIQVFGMKGKKLVSSILNEAKISKVEKESTYVICLGKQILALIEHRRSALFPISENTKMVIKIEFLPYSNT